MLRIIAFKEVKETFRDGRFRLSAAIVAFLMSGALLAGWEHYREVRRQHEAARLATRQNWLAQGVKNPHSAAHYGVYAFKPKSPLSLVDPGADAFTGVAVWLEAHKQNEFRYRPVQDANTLARFGQLTASMVLQILLPLIIVLIGFSAFAGEREQGTLRQLMALGVDPRQLGLGKAGGLCLALGTLLVPAALAGAGVLIWSGEDRTFADTSRRILLMAAAYILYFGAITAVTMSVSARMKSSRAALITLLALWIGNCLVAPRAASDFARRAVPTPSAFQFAGNIQREIERGVDGRSTPEQRAQDLTRQVLAKYGADDVKKLPVGFAGISLQANEEHGFEVFDRQYGQLWDKFVEQDRLQQLLGEIAPFLSIRSISMSLSGTDIFQHRDFAVAAEDYRRDFIKAINRDIEQNAAGKAVYMRGGDLWQTVPEFKYSAPPVSRSLSQQWISIVLMAIWFGSAALLARRSVSRLSVD